MKHNQNVQRAIRARDAYEWAYIVGNPASVINRAERAYSKALSKLTPSERDYVAYYSDCQ